MSDLRNQVYPENGLDPFPGEGRVVGPKTHKAVDRTVNAGECNPTVEPDGGRAVRGRLPEAVSTIRYSPSSG